jgi:hypothetical protein
MSQSGQQVGGICCFGGSFASLRATRTLFTCEVIFGEALFARFAFPVIVTDAAPIHNNSAAELPKHRPCRDDGNLTRAVGIRKNILLNEIIFLDLGGDDFVQRPILVEK